MTTMKWRCKICGYIHEGPEPPEACPVCGAPKSEFELVREEASLSAGPEVTGPSAASVVPLATDAEGVDAALASLTYGLYIVSSKKDGSFNAQTANTVFQITSKPPRVALGINKNNLTHEYIRASGEIAITILGRGNLGLVKRFGLQTGRKVDKFAGLTYVNGPQTGCPIIPFGAAYLECRVMPDTSVDVGTHTLFVAEVVGGGRLKELDLLTYDYYRQNRSTPEELVDNVDLQNVITSLNLGYGAHRRYEYQIKKLAHPRINSFLEGISRTEEDHVENALQYVSRRLSAGARGFNRTLMHLRLNLEFEGVSRDAYRRFARQTDDPALKEMFEDQARSEMGHVNIFQSLIKDIEECNFPIMFYCPVCGWEVSFGLSPVEGEEVVCQKCGVRLRLKLQNGDWAIDRAG